MINQGVYCERLRTGLFVISTAGKGLEIPHAIARDYRVEIAILRCRAISIPKMNIDGEHLKNAWESVGAPTLQTGPALIGAFRG
jgi:hypothetical protein